MNISVYFTVSALVSAYNSRRFIAGCLDDLIAQTLWPRIQIIVIDSGSLEDEKAIVRDYQESYPENIVYFRTEERETIYAAWNRAIRLSSGRYLTNANTDDRHYPHALESMSSILDRNPEVAVVYANSHITFRHPEDVTPPEVHGRTDWPEFDPQLLQVYNYIGPQPMWRRSVHQDHGYFDPSFTSAGDYDFWLRLTRSEKFVLLPECLGIYHMRPDSAERRDKVRSRNEVLFAQERNRKKAKAVPRGER